MMRHLTWGLGPSLEHSAMACGRLLAMLCALMTPSVAIGVLLPTICAAQGIGSERIAPNRAQGAQETIVVIEENGKEHKLGAADFSRLPRHKARVSDREKKNVEFQGVLLADLLQAKGVVLGKELKGERASCVIVLEADDGYRVAVSLLEIDPATTDTVVMLANRRDGRPLGENEGPFRLVIPSDKRQVRWIRMIRTLRVLNLRNVPLRESAHSQ